MRRAPYSILDLNINRMTALRAPAIGCVLAADIGGPPSSSNDPERAGDQGARTFAKKAP